MSEKKPFVTHKYHCKWYAKSLSKLRKRICKRWYEYIELPYLKSQLGSCGENVVICEGSRISGKSNLFFANNVVLGSNALIYSIHAKVYFGNHVITGPNLTIMTGDHRTDLVGRYIDSVSDKEKLPQNDSDVIIEDDVWIGVNVSVFKGVTIGRGSVIAGAATVVRDVPPYSIYINKDIIYPRFTEEQIKEHEKILYHSSESGEVEN